MIASDKYIPGRGPLNAEIVVIGEAPGRREMESGAPFVGPSGRLQDEWVTAAGLNPNSIRYENVYPTMPPGGDINSVPYQELLQWQEDCLVRLDDQSNLHVIVPTGNTALSSLIKSTPAQAKITQRRGGIYLWTQTSGRQIKVIPVIHPAAVLREEGERSQEGPSTLKKNYESRCRADWRKIAREVHTGIEDTPPRRELWTQPSIEHWEGMVRDILNSPPTALAFDIETHPDSGKILCISFAVSPRVAVSVPWSKAYWPGIADVLASDAPKITQNGHYDCYWLAQAGFRVTNWRWDTMAMHCLLEPGEPHSLAYLTSIYTREPWYKGRDEDTGEKAWQAQDWYALLDYNARDSAVTWEVWAALLTEIGKRDGTDNMGDVQYAPWSSASYTTTGGTSHPSDVNYRTEPQAEIVRPVHSIPDKDKDTRKALGPWMRAYLDQYQTLFRPILKTMLHGMDVNKDELSHAFIRAMENAGTALDDAHAVAGHPLFTFDTQVQEACWRVSRWEWDPNDPAVAKKLKRAKGDEEKYIKEVEAKGISTQLLAKTLYQEMGVPTQRKRRTGAVTTDEAALLKLRQRYKDTGKFTQAVQLIEHALLYREQKKQSEFLDPERLDNDGRFRASYSFRPTTGRLSSSSNPTGTGGNAQNIDRALRTPFIADPGCVLVEVDLSQAESRDVYCLTRNPHLIEMAHLRPSQFDVHTYMAGQVLGFGPWDANTTEGKAQKSKDRYLAKRVVHATHYDMHETKGSEVCLKDGYDISPKKFGQLQRRYKDFADGLEDWQMRTRMEGLRERQLANAWERTIMFPYDKPGEDWYRRLYAWRPQSDIARHLNYAWICLDRWLEETGYVSQINLQLHDALILSCPPEESYDVMNALVTFCEEPHMYYGELLSVPAEIKLGLAWGTGKEFKEKPTREEWDVCLSNLING